jgi:hypothetical protein
MSDDTVLRISDADRQRAASLLAEHYAQGRLTLEEFDERSSAALAARTRADVDPLFADLPSAAAPAIPPMPPAPSPPARPRQRPRGGPIPVVVLVGVMVALAFIVGGWVIWMALGVLWWTQAGRWSGCARDAHPAVGNVHPGGQRRGVGGGEQPRGHHRGGCR